MSSKWLNAGTIGIVAFGIFNFAQADIILSHPYPALNGLYHAATPVESGCTPPLYGQSTIFMTLNRQWNVVGDNELQSTLWCDNRRIENANFRALFNRSGDNLITIGMSNHNAFPGMYDVPQKISPHAPPVRPAGLPVPEPATLLLLGSGLTSLAILLKKKRH